MDINDICYPTRINVILNFQSERTRIIKTSVRPFEYEFGIAPLSRAAERRSAESPLPLSRAIDVARVRNASPTHRSRTRWRCRRRGADDWLNRTDMGMSWKKVATQSTKKFVVTCETASATKTADFILENMFLYKRAFITFWKKANSMNDEADFLHFWHFYEVTTVTIVTKPFDEWHHPLCDAKTSGGRRQRDLRSKLFAYSTQRLQ